MAVNDSESMNEAFAQGSVDCTYMQLTPGRKNVENPPIERLTWPTFANVERWIDPPHLEAHLMASMRPVERFARYGNLPDPRRGDQRY